MKRLSLIAFLLIAGCSTTQQQNALSIAGPLVKATVAAAATYYGLPPSSTTAIMAASDSLWGALAQAQAGQPVQQGAVNSAIGNAIAAAIPEGTPQSKTTAALQAAAVSLQASK